jgi:hypothetical protein
LTDGSIGAGPPVIIQLSGKNPIYWNIQNKYFKWPYSNEIFYTKALEYKEYFDILTWGEFRRVQDNFKILLISNSKCLAKRWVKYTIVLVCVMLWRHLISVRKVITRWGTLCPGRV